MTHFSGWTKLGEGPILDLILKCVLYMFIRGFSYKNYIYTKYLIYKLQEQSNFFENIIIYFEIFSFCIIEIFLYILYGYKDIMFLVLVIVEFHFI